MSTTEIEEHDDVPFGGLLPELRQICLQNLDSFTSIVGVNDHGRQLDFKKLNHLTVTGCNQLKYLFPLYVLKDLEQLKNIDISDCKNLGQVFVDDEQDTQPMNSMEALPLLHSLKLNELPELASICLGAGHVISRSLTQMAVENCPKFIFTFAHNPRSIEEQEPSNQNKSKETIINPSKLENLNLCEVDHLKKMYKDPWVSFMRLTSLQLRNCNGLEYLFSLSMAQKLSSLQELKIISCQMIEQIVKRETEDRASANTSVEFPQVETLILDQLPKFTGLSSQDAASIKWLALKTVQVTECPKIQKSKLGTVDRPLLKNVTVPSCSPWAVENLESNIGYLFDLTDELSKLENLKIEDSKQLKKYMEMKLQDSSFTQLKTVEALQCDNELNKFLSILLGRSYKLERLTVENCELLEQVFDLTGFVAEEQLKFPNLNTMQLRRLPSLKCIWNVKDPKGIVGLGKLVKLEINKCGLRKSPLSTALLKELVHLEELKIESCEIEQVIEDDTEIQGREVSQIECSKLKNLKLASLPKLIKFNSGHCNFSFPNLLSLMIEKCPKLNVLSNQTLTTKGTSDQVPQNEMMTQHPCPKLQELKLAGLEMLEDMSQGQYYHIQLSHLEVVELDSFSRLTYMWIAGSENLKTLVVRNCTSLGHLVLPSNCVNLKEIQISGCKILEEIRTEPEQEKTNEKTFHQLKCIFLENLPVLSFFSLETCEFPSLKELRIVNCPRLKTLPRNVSVKADKTLNKHSASLVLFDTIKEDSPAGEGQMKIPPQLESLELTDLPNMQLLKREPEIPVFQNLKLLKIMRCTLIDKLFSISVAKSLLSLKWLTLYGCENMVQVLSGGGGNSKQVVFQQLETLVLKHLPSLTHFCEEDDVDFGEFPELKMVRVEDVPKMETFVKKVLKTPKLEQVHVTPITKCWQGNLNQTIEFLQRNHDMLKDEVWESDQSSTRHHADTAESSSQASWRFKEAAETELLEGIITHRTES